MNGKTTDLIARVISGILAPLLTPVYGIAAVFIITPLRFVPAEHIAVVTSVVFLITAVLPGIAVWMLTKTGIASDYALSERKDRLFPYITMCVALVCAGIYLHCAGAPDWLPKFYYGAAGACIVNLAVNFRWKISAHGAGMGGLTALFVILSRYAVPGLQVWIWVFTAAILTGLLGAARVWLGRHTPMQTVCGAAVGFLAVFLAEIF